MSNCFEYPHRWAQVGRLFPAVPSEAIQLLEERDRAIEDAIVCSGGPCDSFAVYVEGEVYDNGAPGFNETFTVVGLYGGWTQGTPTFDAGTDLVTLGKAGVWQINAGAGVSFDAGPAWAKVYLDHSYTGGGGVSYDIGDIQTLSVAAAEKLGGNVRGSFLITAVGASDTLSLRIRAVSDGQVVTIAQDRTCDAFGGISGTFYCATPTSTDINSCGA